MKEILKNKASLIVGGLLVVIILVLSIVGGLSINNLNKQVDDLNGQIENMTKTDVETKSYIEKLENEVKDLTEENIKLLEERISLLNERIKCLENDHLIDTLKEITYTWGTDYETATASGYCARCLELFSEEVVTSYSEGILKADFTHFEDLSKEIIITSKLTIEEVKTHIKNLVSRGETKIIVHTPSDASIDVFTAIKEGILNTLEGTIDLTISGATSIPTQAFGESNSYVAVRSLKSIYLSDVTEIAYESFDKCINLVKVDAPKVQSLDGYAFYNCSALVEVNMPELTYATYGSFYGCSSLITISLPKLVTADSNALFGGCTNLETVYLPSLIEITHNMFMNCENLKYVYVPKVTTIGVNAFNGAGKEGSYYTLELTTTEEITFGNVAFGNSSLNDVNPVDKFINLVLNINKANEINGNTYKGYTFNSITTNE